MSDAHDDDDALIPWTEELPPRIPDDEYDAVVISVKRGVRFKRHCADFRFRIPIGECFGAILPGYCNLGSAAQPIRVRPRSKFASWQRVVAAFSGGSPSKVTLKAFQQYWFRVRVKTVTHNDQNQALHERDQYSCVTDITAVVGKLGDRPEDGASKGTA